MLFVVLQIHVDATVMLDEIYFYLELNVLDELVLVLLVGT